MTSHRGKIIKVNEEYQTGYSYILNEPVDKNIAPDFRPDLTPKEMLELGVFGGHYFPSVPNEFPKSWFANAKLASGGKSQKELNYFGIIASQPRAVWEQKGWMHKDDPLGWFLWY